MILASLGTQLYEIRLALLTPLDPDSVDKPRYFNSSEQLVSYLQKRPNQKFRLEYPVSGLGELLAPAGSVDAYGSNFGDVLCGDEVYYDSTKERILSFTQIARMWSG